MTRYAAAIIGTALAFSQAASAWAAPETRVVRCGSASCLLVSGHRKDASSKVDINGHEVVTEGARNWRVRVPVTTVRAWSAPFARTISVAVAGVEDDVDLPIGLLGHSEDLAMLVVRVK